MLIEHRFLRTNLVSNEVWDAIERERGAALAEKEDAAEAVLHLASDQSIHGMFVFSIMARAKKTD